MPDECDHHWIPERDEDDRVTGEVVCPKCEAVLSHLLGDVPRMLVSQDLTVSGIGRDEHAPHGAALVLYLNRRPTDDEMRAILEGMRDLVNGG